MMCWHTDDSGSVHLAWMREAIAMVRYIHPNLPDDLLLRLDRPKKHSRRVRYPSDASSSGTAPSSPRHATEPTSCGTYVVRSLVPALHSSLRTGIETRGARSHRSHPRGHVTHTAILNCALSPRGHDALRDRRAVHHVRVRSASAGRPSSILRM